MCPAGGLGRVTSRWLVTCVLLIPAFQGPAQEAGGVKSPPTPPNRLARESSPYLLAHAQNPVAWYPWGEEAFAVAKQQNKPIFLSVGYSSCHWCHVMERESFCDAEIAAFLNDHFICVKVDREERPDVDAIYMAALQIYNQSTGSGAGGGWPMSMFLTPDARPFFGGTYFPPRDGDRGARVGFLTLLRRVAELWKSSEPRLREDGETLTRLVRTQLGSRPRVSAETVAIDLTAEVFASLAQQFDPQHGGFGFSAATPRSPKFPEPSNLLYLMDLCQSNGTPGAPPPSADGTPATPVDRVQAKAMLLRTLDAMADGGIRDHIGGGFHRYSVDRAWEIPHFEKMLYDNGQLASVYSAAFVLTGDEDYRQVTTEILEFVARELTSPDGSFYSAVDADSEGEEGKFYRWERNDIERLIPAEGLRGFASQYGFDSDPNFEAKYFIPVRRQSWPEISRQAGKPIDQVRREFAATRQILLAERGRRVRPATDTKVLTSWNGLMIRGYADAGRHLQQPEWIACASRAADFALNHLRAPDGRLWRTYRPQPPRLNAYLDDYAFLVDGLIGLHQATGDDRWLRSAEELTHRQLELFWDEERGGFFFTSSDHESLIARGRDPTDGAEPAGNSVAAANLVYLAQALNRPEYREKAERCVAAAREDLSGQLGAAPRLAIVARILREQRP